MTATTPESPRRTWPQRQFRLDDQTMRTVRVKLATEDEKLQAVMETLLHGWLTGVIDLPAIRSALEAAPTE